MGACDAGRRRRGSSPRRRLPSVGPSVMCAWALQPASRRVQCRRASTRAWGGGPPSPWAAPARGPGPLTQPRTRLRAVRVCVRWRGWPACRAPKGQDRGGAGAGAGAGTGPRRTRQGTRAAYAWTQQSSDAITGLGSVGSSRALFQRVHPTPVPGSHRLDRLRHCLTHRPVNVPLFGRRRIKHRVQSLKKRTP